MTTDTLVLPSMTAAAPDLPRPRSRLGQLGVDTGYVLLGFPLGIAAFVVAVTGLAAGAGLLVVWVGVAVLTLTLLAARGFATAERTQLPAVLGRPLPRPAYRRAAPDARPLTRLTTPLRDAQSWLDVLHAVPLVVTPGAVEKHSQHIFAKLDLAPDEDQHRRVMATLAYLRG